MAPNKKVVAAYRAMGSLGIDESKVKSALKKLLKVFDKNWELIEAENYRVLVDAIFEEDDTMVCFPLYVLSLKCMCMHVLFLLHAYFQVGFY